MTDTPKRPILLTRAARLGVDDYDRARDLPLLLPALHHPITHASAVAMLTAEEATVEALRNSGDQGYSISRQIGLLIALIAETAASRADTTCS